MDASLLNQFAVGDRVTNFGHAGDVVEVDPIRGLLLRDPARPRAGKWHADPAKCVKVNA